jgi:hypothetical protein
MNHMLLLPLLCRWVYRRCKRYRNNFGRVKLLFYETSGKLRGAGTRDRL